MELVAELACGGIPSGFSIEIPDSALQLALLAGVVDIHGSLSGNTAHVSAS
jgi:hypothetical protein